MDLLRRHVGLEEEKRAAPLAVLGDVGDQHRMAGEAALDEHVPGGEARRVVHPFELLASEAEPA